MGNESKGPNPARESELGRAIEKARDTGLPLALRELGLSESDVLVLKDSIAKGATDGELAFFLRFCKSKSLDPFAKQVHLVKRWDADAGRETMTIQTGIDGYRVIAERCTGYEGGEGPFWCGADGVWKDVWLDEKGPPKAARFTVFRAGRRPYVGTAHFREYAQTKKGGDLNRMWATMSAGQIAKCAEALALRRAFPEDLGNVHTDVEMAQANNMREEKAVNPPPDAPPPPSKVQQARAALQQTVTVPLVVVPTPSPAAAPVVARAPVAGPAVEMITPAEADAIIPPEHRTEIAGVSDVHLEEGDDTGGHVEGEQGDPNEDDERGDPPPEESGDPPPVATPPVVETPGGLNPTGMATIAQAQKIKELLDLMGVPRTTTGANETGARLMVLRAASRLPNITKISELTIAQADAAIESITAEARKRGVKIP